MSNKNIKLLPTQQYLLECFRYDKENGTLWWRERPLYHFDWNVRKHKFWNTRCANKIAGSINHRGYLELWTTIDNIRRSYLIHRLIWKLIKGEEPGELIDHIDNNKLNNKIENLRVCTHLENHHNTKKRVTNTSGYKGVCWVKDKQKFKARIRVDGKVIHLGYFDDPEEAHEVYCEASLKYHKEFSNFG